uniref:Uncharacterized protein n=1 Tax=Oryza brachyantha TaxID=4533 RepID=J3N7K6_ORYBR
MAMSASHEAAAEGRLAAIVPHVLLRFLERSGRLRMQDGVLDAGFAACELSACQHSARHCYLEEMKTVVVLKLKQSVM